MEYESDLATFWGSWAFLVGSVIQVGEVVWREPTDRGDGGGNSGGGSNGGGSNGGGEREAENAALCR